MAGSIAASTRSAGGASVQAFTRPGGGSPGSLYDVALYDVALYDDPAAPTTTYGTAGGSVRAVGTLTGG
jgi:hypothetical protein